MIMWWCGVESLISCDEKWPSIFKSKIMAECPGIKCWCRDNIYNSVWCPGVPTTALITIFRPFICPPIAVPSNLRVPSYELELSSDQNQFGFDPPVKMFLRSAIFALATLKCCYCEIYTDQDIGQSLHDGYQNRLDIADILPSEELFHLTSDLFERVQTYLPSYSTARSLIEARTSSLVTTLANKQMNLKVIILIVSQVWSRQVGKHGAGVGAGCQAALFLFNWTYQRVIYQHQQIRTILFMLSSCLQVMAIGLQTNYLWKRHSLWEREGDT